MHILMFLLPQLAGGAIGTVASKFAVEDENLRIQTPGLPDKGKWTDLRFTGGMLGSGIGVAMLGMKNGLAQLFGLLLLSASSAALGSWTTTEIVHAKALALKGGAPGGSVSKTPQGRISAAGDLMGDAYDYMGADGCSPGEVPVEAVEVAWG